MRNIDLKLPEPFDVYQKDFGGTVRRAIVTADPFFAPEVDEETGAVLVDGFRVPILHVAADGSEDQLRPAADTLFIPLESSQSFDGWAYQGTLLQGHVRGLSPV